jgi:hypothetical protein
MPKLNGASFGNHGVWGQSLFLMTTASAAECTDGSDETGNGFLWKRATGSKEGSQR